MRKYLTILRLGWLDAIEYRTEFFVSLFGWVIRLFIAIFLWLAVAKAQGGHIGTYSYDKLMTYFFLVQMLSGFIFTRIGFDISLDIYRGDIANYLLKPVNYLMFRLMHELSKNVFRTVIGTVIFGAAIIFFFEGIPAGLWKLPFALLAISVGYLLNFAIVSTIALSSFWVTNATRFTFIYFGILTIFSGMIVPIDLFPPALKDIFSQLPLAYIFYFPIRILQAESYVPEFGSALLVGLAYTTAALLFMRLIYIRGVRHFEGVGR